MRVRPADDPILQRFRAALDRIYGDRIERVVLFGSRARGDARKDPDYDVAVFLKDLDRFWDEVDRLVEVETDILYDTGAVINAMPYRAGAYEDRTSLRQEIRREGVDL
jgi:predicted nucleotidyltransferase